MRIKADDLEQAVRDELEQYGVEVREAVDAAVLRVARSCLAQIRRNSPRRTGDYRKGWTMLTQRGLLSTVAIIYNRARWFLIHLLEFGHQKASGGRQAGHPHIAPAAEDADRELMSELESSLRGR